MIRRSLVFLLLFSSLVFAQAEAKPKRPQKAKAGYRIRLVPIGEGLANTARNLPDQNVRKTQMYLKASSQYKLDLSKQLNRLVAYNFNDGKVFSLYYTTLENAFGDRPYVIQRLKMTKKQYDKSGKVQSVKTEYLVEVFKTKGGSLRSYDEHHGGYNLGTLGRRVILKELEIGYGEIPKVCEGKRWPFDDKVLYERLQDYDADRTMYDAVQFQSSVKYSLRVELDDDDKFSISSPEFGFRLPDSQPSKESSQFKKNESTKKLVLTAGQGGAGVIFGKSTGSDVQKRLGKHIEAVHDKPGEQLYSYRKGLTLKVEDRRVTAMYTQPSFAGRTRKGIRLGDKKAKVAKAYGRPTKLEKDRWGYRGIVFYFDGFDRVKSVSLYDRISPGRK